MWFRGRVLLSPNQRVLARVLPTLEISRCARRPSSSSKRKMRATASLSPTNCATSLGSRTPLPILRHHRSPVLLLPRPPRVLQPRPRNDTQSRWFALVLPQTCTQDLTLGHLRIRLKPRSLLPSRFPWSHLVPLWRISPSPLLLAGNSFSGSRLRRGPRPNVNR